MVLLLWLCLMLFTWVNCECNSENERYKLVETHDGCVRGIRNTTLYENVGYYSFLGIPYAEKPINDLRFKVYLLKYFS